MRTRVRRVVLGDSVDPVLIQMSLDVGTVPLGSADAAARPRGP